jgi:dTMP kinase
VSRGRGDNPWVVTPPPSHPVQQLAGRFVVFDGPDGSGKSTQFARFAAWCREQGMRVTEVREPGGTTIGEQIRTILLDPRNDEMELRCEMLLYMASRAQLVARRIRPALAAGEFVLADRFISSTLAYQGAAGGLAREEILRVGHVAVGDCWPHLTVIFDVDEATASRRLVGGASKRARPTSQLGLFADRMEQQGAEYRRRVREGYLYEAGVAPERYAVIDATKEPDAVFAALIGVVDARLAPGVGAGMRG